MNVNMGNAVLKEVLSAPKATAARGILWNCTAPAQELQGFAQQPCGQALAAMLLPTVHQRRRANSVDFIQMDNM